MYIKCMIESKADANENQKMIQEFNNLVDEIQKSPDRHPTDTTELNKIFEKMIDMKDMKQKSTQIGDGDMNIDYHFDIHNLKKMLFSNSTECNDLFFDLFKKIVTMQFNGDNNLEGISKNINEFAKYDRLTNMDILKIHNKDANDMIYYDGNDHNILVLTAILKVLADQKDLSPTDKEKINNLNELKDLDKFVKDLKETKQSSLVDVFDRVSDGNENTRYSVDKIFEYKVYDENKILHTVWTNYLEKEGDKIIFKDTIDKTNRDICLDFLQKLTRIAIILKDNQIEIENLEVEFSTLISFFYENAEVVEKPLLQNLTHDLNFFKCLYLTQSFKNELSKLNKKDSSVNKSINEPIQEPLENFGFFMLHLYKFLIMVALFLIGGGLYLGIKSGRSKNV